MVANTIFKKGIIVLFLVGVLVFYLWTASTSYHKPFQFKFKKHLGQVISGHFSEERADYYNALAAAFFSRRTNLLITPPKELLTLKDPYDPSLNELYRMHDLSLYKGKYYLYFGAAPVLTLFMPLRIIFGRYIPQDLATVIFG
ncbi:MAG: hypothetical protein JW946_03500, partial [Candidatus Omnitrophica bacterium]|nr:hypothetical protein [Candidatus Omnitrophota bacterium]